ncbi:MAG: phosphate uptake regulator PhoU [Nitrososphaerota archaeon]|nr:phosphate uptake regulator PhoU [Nitrososphaerota archaeon]
MPESSGSGREDRGNKRRKKESMELRKIELSPEYDEEDSEVYDEAPDARSFERILQKSGRGSVAVILPRSWVDKGSLKVHDRIFLKWQQDGSLRLGSLKRTEGDNTIFVIDANHGKPPNCLGRSLISAYIEGYNAVKITTNTELTKDQHDDVLAHASKLIGLAVVGENINSIMIRCYLDPLKNDISQLFVRIYSLSSAMLRLSLDALVNSDMNAAERVKKLDGEVDKIYYLILRQLFTAVRNPIIADSLHIDRPLNIVGDRAVAHLIDAISDTWHNACTNILALQQ